MRAGDESVRYIATLLQLHAILLTTALAISGRSIHALVDATRNSWQPLIGGGTASAGAYLLVMIAARTTPLGLVAGLRETEVSPL